MQKEAMKVLYDLKVALAVTQQSKDYQPITIGLMLLKDIIAIIGTQSAYIQQLKSDLTNHQPRE